MVVLTNSMTSLPDSLAYRAVDMAIGAPDRDWSGENLKRYNDSRKEFYDRIREAVTPKMAGGSPTRKLDASTGKFRCPLMGDATVSLESDKLVLRILANTDMVADLEPIHFDTFRIRWRKKFAWYDDGSILFLPDASGDFVELKLDVPNDDLWFHELQFRRIKD